MLNKQDGYITPMVMTVIFSLCILLLGLSFLLYSNQRKLSAYDAKYQAEKKMEKLLVQFEKDFQKLTTEQNDSVTTKTIQTLRGKYTDYSITFEDVSTKINQRFLKPEIIQNKAIIQFIEAYGDNVLTDYGWANPECMDPAQITNLITEFKTDNLYPLIVKAPLFNIHYMNIDFITAILKLCNIQNAYEKAIELYAEAQNDQFTIQNIQSICNVGRTHQIFNYLGTKTTFWKITLSTETATSECIYALVFDKEDTSKTDKYVLIKKQITFQGDSL